MKETHKLWAALIITGIIGGIVGIVLTEIMHAIQHLAMIMVQTAYTFLFARAYRKQVRSGVSA